MTPPCLGHLGRPLADPSTCEDGKVSVEKVLHFPFGCYHGYTAAQHDPPPPLATSSGRPPWRPPAK